MSVGLDLKYVAPKHYLYLLCNTYRGRGASTTIKIDAQVVKHNLGISMEVLLKEPVDKINEE